MTQELPSAPEIEANIVSSIIQAPNNIYNCLQLLHSECFYQKKYRILWDEILTLHNNREQINIVTIQQNLADKGLLDDAGGLDELIHITTKYFTSDVVGHSKILYQKYMRRKAILEAYNLIRDSYDTSKDIFDTVSNSKKTLFEAVSPSVSNLKPISQVIEQNLIELEDNLGKYQEVVGVPTGFESYDKRTSGLSFEGDLIILAGRPGMGKTTLAVNMLRNAQSKFGYSGLFFSLEMSEKQLARMIMAKDAGLNTRDIKQNKLNEIQLGDLKRIFDNPLKDSFYVDDTAGAQLSYILATAAKAKQKHDIKWIVIDYLQLISCPKEQTRALEVGTISRSLKQLAKNLEIPIIALAQLSRSCETRGGDKRPLLSDLRDSGEIEQDADIVTFVFRPEYYGIEKDENGNSLTGVTELITRKNRHGDIGIDYVYFNKQSANFDMIDIEAGHTIPVDDYNMNLVTMQDINYHNYEFNPDEWE